MSYSLLMKDTMTFCFDTTVERFEDSPIWVFFIPIPIDVAEQLVDKNRRVLCSIKAGKPIHCALMHDGSGGFFINLNKELIKKHNLQQHDKVSITLEKDDSRYGIFVPDFFEELCHQDPVAKEAFHQLTMGKQRSLLHIMGKPKSEQKQLEKALIIFEYLKDCEGELDFKALNEAFKNSRFKQ